MADVPAGVPRDAVDLGRAPGGYAGERLSWNEPRPEAAGPVAPRPAATVILLRWGEGGGVEVFMVRRSASSRFAADAFVFPGGTVQDEDSSERAIGSAPTLPPPAAHARLAERGGDPPSTPALSFGLHIAALRELFEEAGVLLAADARGPEQGREDPARAARLTAQRARLQRGEISLPELAEREGLALAPDRLVYFSHWVTPIASPRRFDTRFFLAEMPVDQTALHCQIETTEGEWLAPATALARCARGELKLVFVTIRHLERLAAFSTVDEALSFAREKPVHTILPVPATSDHGWLVDPEETW